MDLKVNIEGLRGVEEALQEAGPKLAKKYLRKALLAGGEVFQQAARDRAPVLKEATTQRQPGELRDSIDVRITLSAKEESGTAHVGPRREKGGGSDQPGVWGMFEEFGSIHGAAQPYMRPAFDEAGTRAQEAFTEVLKAGLESLGKKP